MNARYGLSLAKNDPNAFILNSASEITHKNIRQFLDNSNIPKNARVICYNCDSKFSQQLSHSVEIKRYINSNYNQLKNGSLKNTSTTLEFKSSKDDYLGIQHATLFDAQIKKDGYFNALLIDYYDFSKRNYPKSILLEDIKNLKFSFPADVETIKCLTQLLIEDIPKDFNHYAGTSLNNIGYFLQENKLLENHVILYYIRTKEY